MAPQKDRLLSSLLCLTFKSPEWMKPLRCASKTCQTRYNLRCCISSRENIHVLTLPCMTVFAMILNYVAITSDYIELHYIHYSAYTAAHYACLMFWVSFTTLHHTTLNYMTLDHGITLHCKHYFIYKHLPSIDRHDMSSQLQPSIAWQNLYKWHICKCYRVNMNIQEIYSSSIN